MNSFVADLNTKISDKVSVNYGEELTYSRHKQTFNFEETDISTEMTGSKSKSEQLLSAVFTSLKASLGKFSMSAGLRYEYANWKYYEGENLSKSQSRVYNNLFPSANISFNPDKNTHVSVGYRQTISRPSYSQLNDNIEYQSRYYYVQGNSKLEPSITNSINLLVL